MATLTEGRHTAEFILSEANGNRSRENGTLVSGQNLKAGAILIDNGAGKLTAATAVGTAGDLDGDVEGILIEAVDATNGDMPCAYLARDAEVNQHALTFPTESTAGGEQAAAIAALLTLGIVCRD